MKEKNPDTCKINIFPSLVGQVRLTIDRRPRDVQGLQVDGGCDPDPTNTGRPPDERTPPNVFSRKNAASGGARRAAGRDVWIMHTSARRLHVVGQWSRITERGWQGCPLGQSAWPVEQFLEASSTYYTSKWVLYYAKLKTPDDGRVSLIHETLYCVEKKILLSKRP